jgi:hypothetical protein
VSQNNFQFPALKKNSKIFLLYAHTKTFVCDFKAHESVFNNLEYDLNITIVKTLLRIVYTILVFNNYTYVNSSLPDRTRVKLSDRPEFKSWMD